MKEGDIAQTNLVLASWSKNICAKGANGTWDTGWRWLVWDLNQLFERVYDDKDPWGLPLPPDMSENAGKPILPNGVCVVVWGK